MRPCEWRHLCCGLLWGVPLGQGAPDRTPKWEAAIPCSAPSSMACWSSFPASSWESACLILLGLMLRDHCVHLCVAQFPHQRHAHSPSSTPEGNGVRWCLEPVFFSFRFLGGGGWVPWGFSLGEQKACPLWGGAPLCPTHCVANPPGASWTEALAFSLNSECCNLATSVQLEQDGGLVRRWESPLPPARLLHPLRLRGPLQGWAPESGWVGSVSSPAPMS